MTLFQVSISSLLIFIRLAYYGFSVLVNREQNASYNEILDKFLSQLTAQFFYLNYAKSFYIYTFFFSWQYSRFLFLHALYLSILYLV